MSNLLIFEKFAFVHEKHKMKYKLNWLYSRLTEIWQWQDFPHLSFVKMNCKIDNKVVAVRKIDCTVTEYKNLAIFSSISIAASKDLRASVITAISEAIIRRQMVKTIVFALTNCFLNDFCLGFASLYLTFISQWLFSWILFRRIFYIQRYFVSVCFVFFLMFWFRSIKNFVYVQGCFD